MRVQIFLHVFSLILLNLICPISTGVLAFCLCSLTNLYGLTAAAVGGQGKAQLDRQSQSPSEVLVPVMEWRVSAGEQSLACRWGIGWRERRESLVSLSLHAVSL